ncbi:TM2 domain-containing protein [Pedobacter glucosidilyticus]|uniref:TM2 domain-containing protein n=1 Tax=Pedobacter glucosidilyticus TaxID=1122941 RepID=UPI00040701C6|nr:TM2 domain-containing protein [Pedobacter glucosidilyticus]
MKKIIFTLLTAVLITLTFNQTRAAFPVAQKSNEASKVINTSATPVAVEEKVVSSETAKENLKSDTKKKVKKEKKSFIERVMAAGSKSQLIALLLAFFVGGLGIHRFYLGYTWQGVVQLLTLGGCGIWSLIDFIRIILGDLQPKNGPYDKTL